MTANNLIPLFSAKTENWKTPKPELYIPLDNEFHFTTDPCTFPDNPLGCEVFYTKETNGLDHTKWRGNVYINPPYGKGIRLWLMEAKAYTEKGLGTVVFNIPSRTDTKWFHEFIYQKPNVDIRFLKGRVKFEGVSEHYKRNSAPFPSMIVIFHRQSGDREMGSTEYRVLDNFGLDKAVILS